LEKKVHGKDEHEKQDHEQNDCSRSGVLIAVDKFRLCDAAAETGVGGFGIGSSPADHRSDAVK
jgi:hypothetical protein